MRKRKKEVIQKIIFASISDKKKEGRTLIRGEVAKYREYGTFEILIQGKPSHRPHVNLKFHLRSLHSGLEQPRVRM